VIGAPPTKILTWFLQPALIIVLDGVFEGFHRGLSEWADAPTTLQLVWPLIASTNVGRTSNAEVDDFKAGAFNPQRD
jgi:hypothetical protein